MEVQRTLVKSPPELWAEVSDVEALTRHLAAFGEITITRVEPESTVAWEGEHASGTVELSASGWGTKVPLSADPVATEPRRASPSPSRRARAAVRPVPGPVQPPSPRASPAPALALLVARGGRPRRRPPTPDPGAAEPARRSPARRRPPDPNPPQIRFDPGATEALLTKVLDDLGQAHHRPFQR